MRIGARLLVVEGLIDPDPSRGPTTEYIIDMQMMAMFGNARKRTEAEFRELLVGAGFKNLAQFQPPLRSLFLKPDPFDGCAHGTALPSFPAATYRSLRLTKIASAALTVDQESKKVEEQVEVPGDSLFPLLALPRSRWTPDFI